MAMGCLVHRTKQGCWPFCSVIPAKAGTQAVPQPITSRDVGNTRTGTLLSDVVACGLRGDRLGFRLRGNDEVEGVALQPPGHRDALTFPRTAMRPRKNNEAPFPSRLYRLRSPA